MSRILDLAGRTAIVTGAGSGICRAIATGYAREGAQIIALDMNIENAETTAREIRDAGGKAQAFALDVTDAHACGAVAQQVGEKVGKISVLLNGAGITRRNGMTGAPETVAKDWQALPAGAAGK